MSRKTERIRSSYKNQIDNIQSEKLSLPVLLFFLFVFTNSAAGFAMQGQPTILELASQSKFVFRGTVRQLNAANLPIITDKSNTVIVRIEEVFISSPSLAKTAGQEITVRVNQPQALATGQQWVFFTVGWLYGQSLGVIEVGRVEFTDDTAGGIRQQIAAAAQTISDQDLQKRLARAELVVVGTVSAVSAAPGQANLPGVTEHDPDLKSATINVESVEKGQLTGQTVDVLFANSIDVAWFKSPKFQQGQSGIFLLFRNEITGLTIQGLTAFDSQAFLPRSELERVRRLIRGIISVR